MPTQEELSSQKERLYESSSLRDDLHDEEAEKLLQWGERQIERIAQNYPDEFEKQCRFLRQLLKGINRFIGQREFNDAQGQRKYMSKVSMYLEPLGYTATEQDLLNRLPEDPKDMHTGLMAILNYLDPPAEQDTGSSPDHHDTNSSAESTLDDTQPDYPEDTYE